MPWIVILESKKSLRRCSLALAASNSVTTYRWLTSDEIVEWVNPECRRQHWVEFNVNEVTPTCRVMGAFEDVEMVGFFGFSLIPYIGPLYVSQNYRSGAVSMGLAEKMAKFMFEVNARGALMVADNPATERLALKFGLERVTSPVFIWKPNPNVQT